MRIGSAFLAGAFLLADHAVASPAASSGRASPMAGPSPSRAAPAFARQEQAARPGSVGEGQIPATWDRPRSFNVTFMDETVRVLRTGDGPQGVIFLAHPDSLLVKGLLRSDTHDYREQTSEGVSLFILEYPREFEGGFVPKLLERYLAGDHALRGRVAGAIQRLLAQIREITGISDILLVGNSMGAGLILADYAELSRDERNSFLLISPMEIFMPPVEQIGPLVRTTLLANEETDPFVQGEAARRWLAKNKNREVAEALEAARDKSDPLAVSLLKGHLTVGDQIGNALLARLVRFCTGGTLAELRRPLASTSFDFQGRKVIMEINGSAAKKIVMFDFEAPFHRLRYRSRVGSPWSEWSASMVAWDFAEPDERGYFAPGLAAAIVHALRRQGAGPVALYGIGAGANVLLHDYEELARIPGVSLILLSPRQSLMPERPWPTLDRTFAFLVANEKTDPGVTSEEFRSWLATNKHPVSEVINHWFAWYERKYSGLAGVPDVRGRNPLLDLPEAPEVYGDFSDHIRDYHIYKLSDCVLGIHGIRSLLPKNLLTGPADRERVFGKK